MEQIKAAAVDYAKQEVTEENWAQFSGPQVFASPEPPLFPMKEPEDSAKAKTVCQFPTASGVVFVPAPNDMPPQYQPSAGHNDATTPLGVDAMIERLQMAFKSQLEDFQKTNDLKIGDLQQSLEAVKEDNEDLMEQVQALKEEGENRDQAIEALKSEKVELRGRIAELERGYEIVHGWLCDKDTEYMDRIRLRHILDCDYPTLDAMDWSRAWRASLPKNADNTERLAKARSLLADCDDADTKNMPDDVLCHFIERPSGTRSEGDRTAHPDNVGESTYKGVIECQPDGQRPLLRQVVAYGLKFSSVDSNQSPL
ncbi:hypothetical protein EDD18DRAFT_1177369 [Armillaria luteobubalina]|uniref:Uncharacterized protein n=1 Tax=Armillaria luteobubalina TaxID=153913 RepID=A0AA39Q1I2_9AGAR|nr:hypothetical protein EDD18DRAFT_1177369 [Armillaria luteobubalina]